MGQRTRALSREEIKKLYATCDQSHAGRHDFTLLTLLFNTGMTLEELADLRVTYLDFSNRWIWAVKGLERPRFVPMNVKTSRALNEWLNAYPQNHFVLGDWGQGIGFMYRFRANVRKQNIKSRLSEIGKRAGITLTAEIGKVTLMRQLLEVSEEGQDILSLIPKDKWDTINLPLENLPPFSVVNKNIDMPMASKGFIPMPSEYGRPPAEDDIIRNGRAMLEKAAVSL
ncbi:MAG: tyrosine-type recombinase/integrase [Chloroflexota bacterium]